MLLAVFSTNDSFQGPGLQEAGFPQLLWFTATGDQRSARRVGSGGSGQLRDMSGLRDTAERMDSHPRDAAGLGTVALSHAS